MINDLLICGALALIVGGVVGIQQYVLWMMTIWNWDQSTSPKVSPVNQGGFDPFTPFMQISSNRMNMGALVPFDLDTHRPIYLQQFHALIDHIVANIHDKWIATATPAYGEFGPWSDATWQQLRSGNCTDISRVVARALIDAGVPPSAMTYAFCDHNGGAHCVLWLRTTQGDYVYSIENGTFVPWARLTVAAGSWQLSGTDGFLYPLA